MVRDFPRLRIIEFSYKQFVPKRHCMFVLLNIMINIILSYIYCNEILFKSKINPKKKLKLLKKKDIINILSFAKKILKTSIREGGSSIKNFNSVDGKSGNFQQNFFVYGREGMPCKSKNCNSIIKKIYISKRSSFLCPRCQK